MGQLVQAVAALVLVLGGGLLTRRLMARSERRAGRR
jgi:hypothetical protein